MRRISSFTCASHPVRRALCLSTDLFIVLGSSMMPSAERSGTSDGFMIGEESMSCKRGEAKKLRDFP